MAWTVASCTPCDRSSTSSLLGRRAAAIRRRSWTSSSSGTWTWNGRIAVRSPSGAERGVGTAPTVLDAVGWVGAGIGHLLAVVSNSAEREDVGPGAGLAERDLHRPFADRAGLADELVQAAVAEHAVPLLVDVHAGGRTRRLAVEEHAEGDRLAGSGGQHEVGIASGEAEGDAAAGPAEHGVLALDRPLAGEGPVVGVQAIGEPGGAGFVEVGAVR